MEPWQYHDWMGWHEQGDGKLFYGLHIENGRIRDFADARGLRLKSAVRAIVDKYNLPMTMSPAQSMVIKDVDPQDKAGIDAILAAHGVKPVGEYDPISRHSMACPALPLCGLAITEAERVMPDLNKRLHALLAEHGMGEEAVMTRMTGCPNGCARPYMAGTFFFFGGGAHVCTYIDTQINKQTSPPLLPTYTHMCTHTYIHKQTNKQTNIPPPPYPPTDTTPASPRALNPILPRPPPPHQHTRTPTNPIPIHKSPQKSPSWATAPTRTRSGSGAAPR